MRLRAILAFFITVAAMIPAVGQTTAQCEGTAEFDVDLRSRFGPTRNQAGIGWCYAYVGADLLTEWMLRKGEIKGPLTAANMVSATDLALTYNSSQKGRQSSSRGPSWNIYGPIYKEKHAEIQRLSGEIYYLDHMTVMQGPSVGLKKKKKELSKDFNARLKEMDEFTSQYMRLGEGGYVDLSMFYGANGGSVCFEKDLPSTIPDSSQSPGEIMKGSVFQYYVDEEKGCDKLASVFPNLDLDVIRATYAKADQLNPLLYLANRTCQRKRLASKPNYARIYKSDGFMEIDRVLLRQIPLGIDVNPSIFGETRDGSHSVAIIGRKFDCEKNEVNYIVRNSWGEKFCEEKLKSLGQAAKFKCDGENFIFERKTLFDSWDAAYYID